MNGGPKPLIYNDLHVWGAVGDLVIWFLGSCSNMYMCMYMYMYMYTYLYVYLYMYMYNTYMFTCQVLVPFEGKTTLKVNALMSSVPKMGSKLLSPSAI
jgi:hypothetical protein